MRRSLVLGLLGLAACSCPPAPDLQRYADADFRTPHGCLEYLRRAATERNAYHLCLTLSDEFTKANDVNVSDVHNFMDEVVANLESRVGALDDVEMGDPQPVPGKPWLARVGLSTDSRRTSVELVQETSVFVTFLDVSRPGVTLLFARGEEILSSTGRELVLRVVRNRLGTDSLTAKDIYRLDYERAWKIRDFAELGAYLQELDAEKKPAPPQKPRT